MTEAFSGVPRGTTIRQEGPPRAVRPGAGSIVMSSPSAAYGPRDRAAIPERWSNVRTWIRPHAHLLGGRAQRRRASRREDERYEDLGGRVRGVSLNRLHFVPANEADGRNRLVQQEVDQFRAIPGIPLPPEVVRVSRASGDLVRAHEVSLRGVHRLRIRVEGHPPHPLEVSAAVERDPPKRVVPNREEAVRPDRDRRRRGGPAPGREREVLRGVLPGAKGIPELRP